jgi:hypothetical protein
VCFVLGGTLDSEMPTVFDDLIEKHEQHEPWLQIPEAIAPERTVRAQQAFTVRRPRRCRIDRSQGPTSR